MFFFFNNNFILINICCLAACFDYGLNEIIRNLKGNIILFWIVCSICLQFKLFLISSPGFLNIEVFNYKWNRIIQCINKVITNML